MNGQGRCALNDMRVFCLIFCLLVCPLHRAAADSAPTVRNHAANWDAGHAYLWAESSANLRRLGTHTGIVQTLEKMTSAGLDTLILEVKPVHGHVIYRSKIAPRLLKWKGYAPAPAFDPIAEALREARRRRLRVLIAVNVFVEGVNRSPDTGKPFGPLFEGHCDWEAWNYALPDSPPPPGTTETATVRRQDEGTSLAAVFVSPHNPAVREYELSIIRELAAYQPDGIILDRARFQSIASDFSPWARAAFEAKLGHPVSRWPEDILTWRREPNGKPKHVPGPLFKKWLVFRAETIHDFVRRAREEAKRLNPRISFGVYVGSWYGEYWNEGANWGSAAYDASRDYTWAPPSWKDAGYAELLDVLFCGLYFPDVTAESAILAGIPASKSVEGAAGVVNRSAGSATKCVGSLKLPDYKGHPEQFRRAAEVCRGRTGGIMLFDLEYLDQYGWWDKVPRALGRGASESREALLRRSAEAFPYGGFR